MKNLFIVLLLVLNTSCFSQEKPVEKCVKVTVERVDPAKVKVTKNNTCTDVVEVETYLLSEWIEIQKEKRIKRIKALSDGKRK